jgi:hypothetical protein
MSLSYRFKRTGWQTASSGAFGASAGIAAIGATNIYLTHFPAEPKATVYRFTFMGGGVSLGFLPVGIDFSMASMPSYGTDVWRCPSLFGDDSPSNAEAFNHIPACILSVGASVGPGWSGAAIFFGSPIPLLHGVNRYVTFITGADMGMPGGSISVVSGFIAGWM